MALAPMRFLVRLENKRKYSPADRESLVAHAYQVVRVFRGDVGNLRVSSSAVEFDLIVDSESNAHRAVNALESHLGALLTLRKLDVEAPTIENAQAIKLGIELFNEERYWESHEALEFAWRRTEGQEKEILQALILIAAAFVHLQKDESDVALSVLKRAYDKLGHRSGSHFGIDVETLEEKVGRMLSAGRPYFFKIETTK